MTIPTFETTFAVPLSCEACVKHVSTTLLALPGIAKVNADLAAQLVSVEGNAAPSAIVAAIQHTGRDAILRGTGTADSAAVAILETHASIPDYVRGLVRMVQVAPSMTLFDVSIRGLSPGAYEASIRESGDISRGPESVGGVWEALKKSIGMGGTSAQTGRGVLGMLQVDKGGVGSIFVDKPIQIWEMIGRSVVITKAGNEKLRQEDPDTLVGVIARSAGVWDNDKMVCSCSGKTVWEERKEQSDRGML